jgi:LPS export ABC transporter protein LptC
MTRFISRPATRRAILYLAIAAVGSYLATRDVKQELQPPVADVDTRLNYALFDFDAMLLDQQGKLAMTIEAPLLTNNAISGIGSVTEPRIFVRENGNEWNIRANSAVVSADREFVSLTGEVNLVRYNALDNDTLQIDTRDLLMAVTSRTATTDSRVTMRHAGDRLAATGMKIDMIREQYELLNEVSAVYDTP